MHQTGSPADAPDLLRGSTPLHWASFGGHLDVVRWLVKTAGADAQAANTDGCTPLFFACERGHLGVAQWLVREAGAEWLVGQADAEGCGVCV
ncbi:ankyrin repeat protein [Ectocarpus siliculosus]|uniref:Ankyrin repeat protein n=1 Tax=Ectocarpus siliculosus TaxID=2880 RepID=D7FSZ7_ECTSI|nr:ankyrin repeat protein [Ectocarpus siliculosus]|eukprot:CBJ31288.1 ankyrin repeat protein [Ectocarpus siliculosus]